MKGKLMVGGIALLCFISGASVYAGEQKQAGSGNVEGFVNLYNQDISYLESEINIPIAENMPRGDKIQSRGKINFEEGKVTLDSADLIYLAEALDGLEKTYKVTTVNALNRIGTYFRKDGTWTDNPESNEVKTEEEMISLAFGDITKGILLSQSVESLSATQAVDKEGMAVFYLDEDAANTGNLARITTEDTGYPVLYQSVTADNLTAGTAAWVNGALVKGNGSDNREHYEQGYRTGYADAMANAGNATINYIRHYHDSTSSCYVPPIIRGYDQYRGDDPVNTQYHIAACSACGTPKFNPKGDWNWGTHICVPARYNCGYAYGEIVGAEIIY